MGYIDVGWILLFTYNDPTWQNLISHHISSHFPHLETGASGTHGSLGRGSRLGDGWTWRTCGYISQPRSGGKLSDSRRILLCSGAKGWKLLDSARSWCPIVYIYIYILQMWSMWSAKKLGLGEISAPWNRGIDLPTTQLNSQNCGTLCEQCCRPWMTNPMILKHTGDTLWRWKSIIIDDFSALKCP